MARPSNRDRILDSFEELTRSHGAAGTSLDAIAGHAGVSKGGLLYHFPSRADLVRGFADRLLRRVDAAVARAPSDPAGVIRWYLEPVPATEADEATWRSILTALHVTDEGADSVIAEAIRRHREPLSVLGPRLAEHVRLLGDGLFLNGVLGTPPPDEAHLGAILEELIGRTGGAEA